MILVSGTGINQTDLMVSERHAVYSLSKEKTAARFYIMQCIKSVNEDVDRVPIKDTIDRFGTRQKLLCVHVYVCCVIFFFPPQLTPVGGAFGSMIGSKHKLLNKNGLHVF